MLSVWIPLFVYPSQYNANISVQVFCTWLVTVSASGAQVTVEPLATGVSTRLVCPRSWQGRGCRTEGLEAAVVADRSVDDRELSWGATTVKVWEEIVPLNIFFLASSTCHRKKMLFILILYISFFLQFITPNKHLYCNRTDLLRLLAICSCKIWYKVKIISYFIGSVINKPTNPSAVICCTIIRNRPTLV